MSDDIISLLRPRVLRALHQNIGPLFIGEISTKIDRNMQLTQMTVDSLVDDGIIRRATHDEIRQRGGSKDSNVYALVGQVNLMMAFNNTD